MAWSTSAVVSAMRELRSRAGRKVRTRRSLEIALRWALWGAEPHRISRRDPNLPGVAYVVSASSSPKSSAASSAPAVQPM
jgi:hypothetical protein